MLCMLSVQHATDLLCACLLLRVCHRTIDFQVTDKGDYQSLVSNLIKYHRSLNSSDKDDGAYTYNSGR